MPNWCENRLHVYGKSETLKKFRDEMKGDDSELSFEKAVPRPAGLEEQEWVKWSWRNWGTKWDVGGCMVEEHEGELIYQFDTAGEPPISWLEDVAELYPDLELVLDYNEPGSCFKGEAGASSGGLDYDEREFY